MIGKQEHVGKAKNVNNNGLTLQVVVIFILSLWSDDEHDLHHIHIAQNDKLAKYTFRAMSNNVMYIDTIFSS